MFDIKSNLFFIEKYNNIKKNKNIFDLKTLKIQLEDEIVKINAINNNEKSIYKVKDHSDIIIWKNNNIEDSLMLKRNSLIISIDSVITSLISINKSLIIKNSELSNKYNLLNRKYKECKGLLDIKSLKLKNLLKNNNNRNRSFFKRIQIFK